MNEPVRFRATERECRAIHARWVLPVAGPPVRDGVVVVREGRVERVGELDLLAGFSADEITRLPESALLPGLVNAHSHLELSGFSEPVGHPGDSFSAWLYQIISGRRAALTTLSEEQRIEQRREAVSRGLNESRQSSVVAIGDIASPGWPVDVVTASNELHVVEFLELLGLRPDRLAFLQDAARAHVAVSETNNSKSSNGVTGSESKQTGGISRGLSPHAPYTVSPDLVAWVASLSAETGTPVAMHLAESFDEYELLSAHSGQMVDVLREFDAWYPAAVPRGIRWTDYLELLAHAARALVVHGNFLGPADWQVLAHERERMTVIYCPRTHARFRHGTYPLAEMLAAGVRVAVGTDSRATNPDLQLWRDLCFAAAAHPLVPAEEVLKLGTLAAAESLGLAEEVGTIQPGRRACFTRLAFEADANPQNVTRLLLQADA